MKHFLLTVIFTLSTIAAMSQYRYSVENCWELAKNNYPAIKYLNLIEKSKNYSLSNASLGKYPQNNDATGTYATNSKDAISLLNKNKASTFNVFQNGSASTTQNNLNSSSLKSNLFVLSERINNLYFSLILIDKKIKLNEILQIQLIEFQKFFTTHKDPKINNANNAKSITALNEKCKADYSTLKNIQEMYFKMLSQMVGRTINEKSVLLEPNIDKYLNKTSINKELELLDNNKTNPFYGKINAMSQSSYNSSNSKYKAFEIAKVKIDESKNLNKYSVNDIKKTLFNINSKEQQETERSEINNLNKLIEDDRKNIDIQKEIIMVSYNKVIRGVSDINNLTQTILNFDGMLHQLSAHEVQLMMAANKFKFLYD